VPKQRVAGKLVKPVAGTKANTNGKPAKKSKAAPAPPSDDEDMLDSDDLMDDNVNVTGLDALGSASEDDSDDAFDSDEEVTKGAMWSDDDEDDLEERLTAANIEGLSKKLDMETAIADAEAAAELEEAMQTNIVDGDRPKILDDEDEEGRPITNLIGAQDVGLLRTRLNDTVRVLDDFKNLAEEGRSRAEYMASLLKDICAYYGYSEFLADKYVLSPLPSCLYKCSYTTRLLNLFTPREVSASFMNCMRDMH
jgi:ribosomal RNA methyltransferase Nop2